MERKRARPTSSTQSFAPERFDAAYFDRYYGDPKTRVVGSSDIGKLVRALSSLAEFWSLPLASALDLGAGVGHWKTALAKERPYLQYTGVDLSPVVCERYGHQQADISRFLVKERFDLVICQGVLQYLSTKDAARAIDNIGQMAGGLVYVEALTTHDVDEVVDLGRTDTDVHLREGAWYRERLAEHLVPLGCGFHYARSGDGVFFELETAE
jgi:predicted TPR repeat methyltransferase